MSKPALIVGSSPHGIHHIRSAFERWGDRATTYTSNGGYALFIAHGRRPNVYYAGDWKSKKLFQPYIDLHGEHRLLESDGSVRWSLQVMTRHAIEHGRNPIIYVGCEWFGDKDAYYFDGRANGKSADLNTLTKWFRETLKANPHIQIKTYGEPAWWRQLHAGVAA